MNQPMTPAAFRKLQRISRTLTQVLFEANRDPQTGTFKSGSAVTQKALRKAWGTDNNAAFKARFLAALRARRK